MPTNLPHRSSLFLRYLRYAHALFKGVLILFLVFLLLNIYVITVFRVNGESMEPTLQNGQLLPILIAKYRFTAPKKGDVVIVQYAGDQSIRFVKRILGVPGDTVDVLGEPIQLKANEYFVVGDNRDHSTDSRVYGPVTRSQIIGQVLWAKPFSEPLDPSVAN